MRLNNSRNNGFKVLKSGAAYTPRSLFQGGIAWILSGIHSRPNGSASNLSGKPTFWERPFKGRLGGGFRPKADIKVKTTLRYFGIS